MMNGVISELKRLVADLKAAFRAPARPAGQFNLKDIGLFMQFILPVWKLGFLSIGLVLVTTAIKAILPLSSKVFIDFVILKDGYAGLDTWLSAVGLGGLAPGMEGILGSIDALVVVLFFIGILYGLVEVARGYVTARYQQELTFNLQTRLFEHVLRFPLSFLKNKQTGYLMSRVSDDVNMLQYLFSTAITQLVSQTLYVAFGIGILFVLNARLALVIAAMIPVYLIIKYVFSRRIRAVSYLERESGAEASKNMQEALSGAETVKSYAAEDKEVEKVSGKLRAVVQARVSNALLSSFSTSIMRGAIFLLLLAIMWLGAREILAGSMTVGDYVAFITYMAFLSASVDTLFYTYITFQPVWASMDRLKEMFSVVPEYAPTATLEKPAAVRGEVKFDHVSFAYDVNEPLLEDLSFTVSPGETVALVGPSGAGKTTTVNLLMKLYEPQSGAIYLDGRDLHRLDHAWLRRQIGIVSQDIFLFNDTIENNIKYGKASATRDQVIEAARKAHIDEDILRMPNGYDTVIGERGAKVSVGQRQRISIARAFLKDTPILILDEPTSALDNETERQFKDSLRALSKDRTTFIISHRMSLVDIASRIVVIDGGRIAQAGTHQELLQANGIYARLRNNL